MKSGFGPFRDKLLGKPSIDLVPFCVICGRPAHDRHHVIQKGMGGVSSEIDELIPKVRLCGTGNLDGCHGMFHQGKLHIYWEDGREDEEPGWVFMFTAEPMDDIACWEMNRSSYLPVPGWCEQRRAEMHIFGSGRERK